MIIKGQIKENATFKWVGVSGVTGYATVSAVNEDETLTISVERWAGVHLVRTGRRYRVDPVQFQAALNNQNAQQVGGAS